MSKQSEQYLFNQIKTGNSSSFEKLFKLFYPSLCHFSKQYINDDDECEEIVQAFFLNLWEKRERLDIKTSVKNYLFSSVRNRCLNYLKHKNIMQEHQAYVFAEQDASIDTSKYFLEIDLMAKIQKCISELPPRRKEIFLLSREQGLKYREIADQLGISIKTVESQMGAALKDLREKLKDYKQVILGFLLGL